MNKSKVLSTLVFASLFTFLFYHESLGLNVLIFEGLLLAWLLISKQFQVKGIYPISVGIGLLSSSIFTVLTHTVLSYLNNTLLFFTLVGLLIYPSAKSLISSWAQAINNSFSSPFLFLKDLFNSKLKERKLGNLFWKSRIFLLPFFVIVVFLIIYSASNPIFDDLLGGFLSSITELFRSFLEIADLTLLITFTVGLALSIFTFYRTLDQKYFSLDQNAQEQLKRERKNSKESFGLLSLKNEYRAGLFLLGTLNVILLILNVIDVKWVWFGFEWQGQYLKQFVHEGTYLLILSIFISIALVLYYFRGNLNFLKTNKLLKIFSYSWLIQNGVLALSVAIRNIYYIDYFALAYKRIGVFVFLLITLYGLYSVFIKVRYSKSPFYLFKTNTYVVLMVLMLTSFVNWDSIIAEYNFSHSKESFLHLDFLVTLSDQSLPKLDVPYDSLQEIELIQHQKFPFEKEYMSVGEYSRIIQFRKNQFKVNWESKGILSWNLPEHLAYNKLFINKK